MKKYTVLVDVTERLYGSAEYTVEAETEEDAKEEAERLAMDDASNGNVSLESGDGIEVDNTEVTDEEDIEEDDDDEEDDDELDSADVYQETKDLISF